MSEVMLDVVILAAKRALRKTARDLFSERCPMLPVPQPVKDVAPIRPVPQHEGQLVGQVGLRIAIDRDVIDIRHVDLAGRKAVADRLAGKAGPMLNAPEPLLLGRGHKNAVANETRCGIAVPGVNAEDVGHCGAILSWAGPAFN